MKRRYHVKPVFIDEDFGELGETRKFFSILSANFYWYHAERERKELFSNSKWRYVVIDTKKDTDVTPNL